MPNISDDAFELHVRFWKRKSEAKMCVLFLSLGGLCKPGILYPSKAGELAGK